MRNILLWGTVLLIAAPFVAIMVKAAFERTP